MNNDAFRALINKQRTSTSGEKSTKEIAREAVENEFQKKRRRGVGGGGGGRRGRGFNTGRGSDSGGSSDEDRGGNEDKDAASNKQQHQKNNDDDPDWKRRRREKSGSGAGGALEYRDRAKERREGNNIDYTSLEGLAAQSGEDDRRRQAELSKYLGGDEKHTHLVKGLDKALAEKVRREEMGEQSRQYHHRGREGTDLRLERQRLGATWFQHHRPKRHGPMRIRREPLRQR